MRIHFFNLFVKRIGLIANRIRIYRSQELLCITTTLAECKIDVGNFNFDKCILPLPPCIIFLDSISSGEHLFEYTLNKLKMKCNYKR